MRVLKGAIEFVNGYLNANKTDSGELYYDADGNGDGARVQFAELSGNPTLAFDDFDIV